MQARNDDPDVPPVEDPEVKLERALIGEYLCQRGHHFEDLERLPEEKRRQLFNDAAVFAAGRLAETDARWHYVEDLHQHESRSDLV